MRLAAVFILALAAAPAFAQQAPQRDIDPEFAVPAPGQLGRETPPPEGFYRDIPNAYDLLLRPRALADLSRIQDVCSPPSPELKDDEAKEAASFYRTCLEDKFGLFLYRSPIPTPPAPKQGD